MDAKQDISLDDSEALTKTLTEIAASSDTDGLISVVVDLIMNLSKDNRRLSMRLQKALRKAFSSSSEKLTQEQLELFQALMKKGGDDANGPAENDDVIAESKVKDDKTLVRKPRKGDNAKETKGHGRKKIPAHIAREVHFVPVPADQRHCVDCGVEKSSIGHTTSERLEYVAASIIVLQEKREKLVCKDCESSVVTAPVVPHIIEGGLVSEGFIAHILVGKYIDGLPLTRLSKILGRQGVPFAESTLGDIVKQGVAFLPRLAEIIQGRVLAAPYLNQDDSGLRVLDRDHPKGVKRGHIWAYVAGFDVVYVYAPDWSGEHPRKFLHGYSGIIQGDGYSGIGKLFTQEPNAPTRAGCMMHCRRYFWEAYKTGDTQAGIILALINELYIIEHNAKVDELSDGQRLQVRQTQSLPRMQRLQTLIAELRPRTLPKSALGQALTYASNQWDSLLVPFSNGIMEIDNGEAERRLRVLATGRRNWLFAGSDEGAHRAALALTVLGTAVSYGLNPQVYLTDVFKQMAGGLPRSRFAELHPATWAEKRSQQTATHRAAAPRLVV